MKGGGGGQYEMVSSSGDADMRILYAEDAHPGKMKRYQRTRTSSTAFQAPSFNT